MLRSKGSSLGRKWAPVKRYGSNQARGMGEAHRPVVPRISFALVIRPERQAQPIFVP